MSAVEVRRTVSADLEELARALVLVYELDGYPVEGVEQPDAWLKPTNLIAQWTALHDQTPIGHIALTSPSDGDQGARLVADSRGAELNDFVVVARLFVHPDYRGLGAARDLLVQAEAEADKRDQTAVLDVITKDSAAIALYKSHGWEIFATTDHPYEGDRSLPALAMVRPPQGHNNEQTAPSEREKSRVHLNNLLGLDEDSRADSIEEAFRVVPPIGKGWRWYDIPYRLSGYLLRSRLFSSLHWVNRFLLRVMSFFIPFSEIERLRRVPSMDWEKSSKPHAGENVSQNTIWAVELFPPSHAQSLVKLMKRNPWLAQKDNNGISSYDWKIVLDARSVNAHTWWRVAEFASIDSKGIHPDAVRTRLPREFESISLQAQQIGTSLTAVVAELVLTDSASRHLDTTWRTDPKPRLLFRGLKRPELQHAATAALVAGHASRNRAHESARKWLGKNYRGYFAKSRCQPVVDLLLFSVHDPTENPYSRDAKEMHALASLGLDYMGFRMTSPQLPGLALNPVDDRRRNPDILFGAWAVYANRAKASDSLATARSGLGLDESDESISHIVGRQIPHLLVAQAVSKYQELLARQIRSLRDLARSEHLRFRVSAVKRLRREMLRTSLDIPWAYRDAREFWNPLGASGEMSIRAEDLYSREFPVMADSSYDFIDTLRQRTLNEWEQLEDDDRRYRDVLATAASLGAAASSTVLARWSIVVAVSAIVVAIVTLFVTM